MNTQEMFSIIILALIFGLYAWAATLEFGVGLLRLLPKWDATNMAQKLTRPFWETANIVLVFGCIGVVGMFSQRVRDVAIELVPTFLVGLAAIIVRCLLLLHLSRSKTSLPVLSALFATSAFMVPASMAAVGIYLLTGQVFWATASGWVFMLMSLALIKVTALAFVYWHAKDGADRRLQWATRMGVGAFALLAAVAAQIVVREDSPHLLSLPFGIIVVVVASTILWQGALLSTKRADHGMWWCLSLVLLALPVCLALANAPWLAYGHFKVSQIFDPNGYALVIYMGIFSGLVCAMLFAKAKTELARKTAKPKAAARTKRRTRL